MFQLPVALLAATTLVGSVPNGVDINLLNQSYIESNGSKYIVVNPSNLNGSVDLKTELDKLGIQFDWNNCSDIILPGFPGFDKPDNKPEVDKPEIDKPETDKPEIDKPETENPDNDNSQSDFATQVLNLVNAERAKVGALPLTVKRELTIAAQVRANEIVTSFSHTRPNGTNFNTVLAENGVSYKGAGENIAWGQKTPEDVMKAWMNSDGHRANILNKSFTSVGVGFHKASSGKTYWTQVFTN